MLARVRRLERPPERTQEFRDMVSASLAESIAEGRVCQGDGPVVLNCVLRWIDEGLIRPS
jgi:hypothetical protein